MEPTDRLLEAIKTGNLESAQELLREHPALARNKNADGVSYVSLAMYHRQPEIAKLLASGRSDLDLYEACAFGSDTRVRQLIGADPALVNSYSPDGFPPIGLAAFFSHPEIVEMLVSAGADVNAQARNPMKVAAIHAAVAARDARSVEILLKNGADPNLEQQEGYTPMMAARQNADESILRLLQAHGGR